MVKRRRTKLTAAKVQTEFNRAIVRRDMACMVRDGSPCSIVDKDHPLQCSHFFPIGGNSGLRFYPYNAFAQCAGHHFSHHNRDPLFYSKWMQTHCPEELAWMESVRGLPVRYSQYVLSCIYESCKEDDLETVREIVRELFA